MISPVVLSKRLLLRPLGIADITDAYLQWLNDPGVTRYLEIRHTPQTYNRVCEYLKQREQMSGCPHFGVFDENGTRHVGTVTLNALNGYYKTADISFVMGHPDARGKGYATEAVHAVCEYAFTVLQLHKLTGGHYLSHIGSQKVFQKNGFHQEGIRREQVVNTDGHREDVILHGLLARDFQRNPDLLDR